MEFQRAEDSMPSGFITEEQSSQLIGRPPASGAWRIGDAIGQRQFSAPFELKLESGEFLARVVLAFESWGKLNAEKTNAILVLHALTGDSHTIGEAQEGHATNGWWNGLIGPGLALDTNEFFVLTPNILGGCQGSTGPSSLDSKGFEYGPMFPQLTIRDQTAALIRFAELLEIPTFHAVVGGSMGGMHALELAVMRPDLVSRLAVLAAPAVTTADQIALNTVQLEAIRGDSAFSGGWYYDAKPGFGPHRGLALARRMALLNYRSPAELNERFGRSWQSAVSPLSERGKYAVESYLDFHGNKFTRRFDANTYISLVSAMNSHDLGRERGDIQEILGAIKCPSLVLGIETDRLFPIANQELIAENLGGSLITGGLVRLDSEFGHDGFLIELETVGHYLNQLISR